MMTLILTAALESGGEVSFNLSYFQLKRGRIYHCSLDSPLGLFEYRITRHYLSYRKTNGSKDEWTGVWNIDYYDEQKASYREVTP